MAPLSISIRWSLLGSLLILLGLLSGAIAAVSALGERRTVQSLSRSITGQTIAQTIDRLERFVDPVTGSLVLLRSWGEAGLLDDSKPEALDRLLVPVMRPHSHISALLIGDERGRYHMLLRTGDRWRSREMRRDQWGARMRERVWTDVDPSPALSWSEVDFDPRTRPWYRGAVEGPPGAAAADSLAPAFVHWTEAYTFYTLRAPGVTATT
ncbi:MAG TPA: hypothetical protein VFF36_12685, partial [Planctomycetota bacterium]|nr:hypothetical protein [Planctomycetota bacterium]